MSIKISIETKDFLESLETNQLDELISLIISLESPRLYELISNHISNENIDELLEPIDTLILCKYAEDYLEMSYKNK